MPKRPRKTFVFRFLWPRLWVSSNGASVGLRGRLSIDLPLPVALRDIEFLVGGLPCRVSFAKGADIATPKKSHHVRTLVEVSLADAVTLPIHSSVVARICMSDSSLDSPGSTYAVRFTVLLPRYLAAHTKRFALEQDDLVAFFRQNAGQGTTFTVRHRNVTDARGSGLKLALAWTLQWFLPWVRPVLVYEKNCRHCEESGRVVFERLVDEGRTNVRFILAKDVFGACDLAPKYQRYVVTQHSFSHYLLFFCCHTFLGTEAMAHALELRCHNPFVLWKLTRKNNNYVFLQHGVMYMVSLDSPRRSSFRRRAMRGRPLIAVSSKLEAEHFEELAGFESDEIIVCGLPKLDRAYRNPGADKILIMPTWREWEFAAMRHDPQSTRYAQMIEQMKDAVPEELRSHVIVALHPLFAKSTFGDAARGEAVHPAQSYDELLRDVALLITDYSSIAYDAFYRGSNVCFFWAEKDECMAHYGGNTHLMIDEVTAFGPVSCDSRKLACDVEGLYGQPQAAEYKRRFARIVEFHDGKNTERLIAALEEKGVLKGGGATR